MEYREFGVPLGGLAECGWTAGLAAGRAPEVRAVLPDGAMDLVWTGTDLLVAGPDTAAHPTRRVPGVIATGVRFRPGALPALLGVPADILRDRRVPLAEFHPRTSAAAVAAIGDGAPAAEILIRTTRALPGAVDHAVASVAGRLAAGASAAETADALGWTTRTLHRRSLAAFGYGPAMLRRVLRFRRAVDLLGSGVPPAAAAARAGFADQPHLSREVRALSGRSPSEWGPGQPGSSA